MIEIFIPYKLNIHANKIFVFQSLQYIGNVDGDICRGIFEDMRNEKDVYININEDKWSELKDIILNDKVVVYKK